MSNASKTGSGGRAKLALVCSSGGHFLEMVFLREFWEGFDRFWVTFLGKDTLPLLRDSHGAGEGAPSRRGVPLEGRERAYDAYHPTNRNVVNLFRNFLLAYRILRRERPDVILSSGAGVGVPFIYLGRLMGMKTIYIELATRVEELSLTAKLVYPVVDHLLVQWPELAEKYGKAEYRGHIV